MEKEYGFLLNLLASALGYEPEWADHKEQIDWEKLNDIAEKQAVVSLAYGGAVKQKAHMNPELLEKWRNRLFSDTLVNERLMAAQDELLSAFLEAGIPAAVLKGSSVARFYPQPGLRRLGDIDLLIKEEDLSRAQKLVEEMGFFLQEHEHSFHVGYGGRGVYLELHYALNNFPENEEGEYLKNVVANAVVETLDGQIEEYCFPVLSKENQSISLLTHMIRHMFPGGIGLRQLCDWAVFVTSMNTEEFEEQIMPLLKKGGLWKYAMVATKVCVEALKVPQESVPWCQGIHVQFIKAFLDDVLGCGNMGQADESHISGFFIDKENMGKKQNSSLRAMILILSDSARKQFPLTQKMPVLLPFFWIFLPVRYWVRSIVGSRAKIPVMKAIRSSDRKERLFQFVSPYHSEE